jgi:hypothetical protein
MSQLEDNVVDLFSNTVKEDGLLIDMEVPGFVGFFKGKDSYNKS